MSKVKIGLVGAGHLGRIHIKCLVEEGYASDLLFYESNPDRAKAISEEFGVQSVPTLDELISASDGVIIVSPTSTHALIAKQCLEAGKHCFIEKPVTSMWEESKELLDLNKDKGLVVQIGHVERFNPAFLEFEKAGLKPKFIECHRLATYNPRGTDVSVVMDLMIHDLDLLLYVVKSPVTEVRAVGVPLISGQADICNARLQFDNNCIANVTASRISMKQMRKMRFFQKDAYATIDFISKELQLYRMSEKSLEGDGIHSFDMETSDGPKVVNVQIPKVAEINAIKEEQKHFIHSIRDEKPPIVSLQDGSNAVELAERIMDRMTLESKHW